MVRSPATELPLPSRLLVPAQLPGILQRLGVSLGGKQELGRGQVSHKLVYGKL